MLNQIQYFQSNTNQIPKRLLSLGLNYQQLTRFKAGYHDGTLNTMPELVDCVTFPIEDKSRNIVGVVGLTQSNQTKIFGDLSTGIFNRAIFKYHKKIIVAGFLDTLDLLASGRKNAVTVFGSDITAFKNIEEVILLRYYDTKLPRALEQANIKITRKI